MTEIHIVIDGEPIQKNRPRAGKRGKKVVIYSDQKGVEQMWIACLVAQIPFGFESLKGPVSVDCVFYKSRPKSHYGTGKNAGKIKKSAPALPLTTPDLDNYEKFAWDCMNKIIYLDDGQVTDSSEKKRYSEQPRTEITIQTL